uniref:thiosulfate oxidation carrier protein SoxY n=1 Tax=Thermus sp. TaxID=275 RepID=UPI00307D42EF
MNRRGFLKTTGLALGALAVAGLPARAQALEGEDLAHLEKALQETLGKGFKDLTPSDAIKLNMPAIAESGANVPAEVEVSLPSSQIKAIHLFAPPFRLFTCIDLDRTKGKGVFGSYEHTQDPHTQSTSP